MRLNIYTNQKGTQKNNANKKNSHIKYHMKFILIKEREGIFIFNLYYCDLFFFFILLTYCQLNIKYLLCLLYLSIAILFAKYQQIKI